MKKRALALLCLFLAIVPAARADDLPDWLKNLKIGGLMFGDAYWLQSSSDLSLEDANGFWIRRMYLTFDEKLSGNFSARLRFEGNSPKDFKTASNITTFVKDAYVRWTHTPTHEYYFGLSPTPTWETAEKYWGYRDVEKTVVDMQRMGAARDMGISLRGKVGDEVLDYHFTVGNGAGAASETNEGKMAALALDFHPTKESVIQVYGDYNDLAGHNDRQTSQVFYGWRREDVGSFGVQYARQTRDAEGADSLNIDVISLFGSYRLGKRVTGILRWDGILDPNPDAAKFEYITYAPNAKANVFIAGVDIPVAKHVHVIPNVEGIIYRGVGVPDPNNELLVKITGSFTF